MKFLLLYGFYKNGIGEIFLSLIFLILIAGTSSTFSQSFVIGTGTQTNTSTGYPAPYGNYYNGAKHQFLYKNYELTSAGLTAGEINKFGFNVANLNNSADLSDLYISMKNTTTEGLTEWETDLIPVYGPINYTPRLGWNLHTLDIPFMWDGSSNIVVEICFKNNGTSNNASTYLEGPYFSNATRYLRGNLIDLCASTSSTSAFSSRPNTTFFRRENYGVSLYNLLGNQSAYSGVTFTYQIEVENLGTQSDIISFNTTTINNWTYILYEHNTTNVISQIDVDSASIKLIDLKVTIPANAVLGAFDEVELKGVSQANTTKQSTIIIKTTAIAPNVNYPFHESFENDFPPFAWNIVNTNQNSGWFKSSFTGYLNSNTSASQIWWQSVPAYYGDEWMISPLMDINTSKEYYLSFYGKANTIDGNNGEIIRIYALTQLSDTAEILRSNGTLLKEIPLTTTFKEYSVDLEPFSGQQIYIAFNHFLQGVTSNTNYVVSIDEVKISEKPEYAVQISSTAPTLIGESGYSVKHSLDIFNNGLNNDIYSLIQTGGELGWNYTFLEHNTNNAITQIAVDGFDTVTVDLKVDIPASANNTAMSTTQITAKSQGDIQISGSITIRTSAVKPIIAPYSENFDNVTAPELPFGWKKIVSHFSTFVKVVTDPDPVNNPVSQPNQILIYNSTQVSNNAQLLLIPPGVENLNQCRIRFWARSRVTNQVNNPVLIIGTIGNPADYSTFTPTDTISDLSNIHKDYSISFQGYSGTDRHIAFKHGSPGLGTDAYILIDNFIYETIPVTCLEPSQLYVTTATQNSVTLDWKENGGASNWEIIYGSPGFNPDSSGALITSINTKPYTIESLTHSTAYEAYIRSVCAVKNYSNWSNSIVFQTEQIPATLPFTETFDDTLSDWTFVNDTQINKWYIGTAAVHSGEKSAYISSTDGATNVYNVTQSSVTHIFRDLLFPDINGSFQLSFYWKAQGQYQSDCMNLFLIPTSVIPRQGIGIASGRIGLERYNQNNQWKSETILLPDSLKNKTYRLVFSWINNNSTGFQPPAAIDSLSLFTIPYGYLSGMVKDSSGTPIPNATVYSKNIIYNANSSGVYFIPNLKPGIYFFTSATGGYSADTATVTITSSDTTFHDFVLPYSNPDLPYALEFMPNNLSNRVSSSACTDGRYIYTSVTGENRVYITDMIDPSAPYEKGYITVQNASKLYFNNYLFVSTTDNKIHILDKASSPDSFIIKIILNLEGRTKDISFSGNIAHILISNLSGANSDKSKLLVYDFTNVANPVIKGTLLFDGISSMQYYNQERELLIIHATNSNETATIRTLINVANKDNLYILFTNLISPMEFGLIGEKNYFITSTRVDGSSYLRTYSTTNPASPVLLKEWEVPENKFISALLNIEGTIYMHTEGNTQLIMNLVYDSLKNNFFRGIDFELTKGWAGDNYVILKENVGKNLLLENEPNRKYYISPTNTSPPIYIIKVEKPPHTPVLGNHKLTISISPSEAEQAGCSTTPSPNTYTFHTPTNVQLFATEVTGWKFSHWTGASGGNPTTLLVEGEKEVVAVFEQIPVLTVAGRKGKQIYCPKELVPGGYFDVGSATFSADLLDDWSFGSFQIDASGSGNDKLDLGSVKIEGPVSLTTTYLQDDGTITVSLSPPLIITKGSSVLFNISYKFTFDPDTYAHDSVRTFNWKTKGVSAIPLEYPPGEIVGSARMDSFLIAPVRTSGGYAFAKIQEAIDFEYTLNGDTILACDGGYVEQLAVVKELHIKSVNGANSTAIITDIDTSVFYKGGIFVNKDNCSLEGFTIYNLNGGKIAVDISNSNNFLLRNNIIENYNEGIYGVGNANKGIGYNISENKFKNINETPIEFSYINQATIQNNYFDYCSEDRTLLINNIKQTLLIDGNTANSPFKIAINPVVEGDNSSGVIEILNNSIITEEADSIGNILYLPQNYDSSSSPMKLIIKNNKNFNIEGEFVNNVDISENIIPESLLLSTLYGTTKIEKNIISGLADISNLMITDSKALPQITINENSFRNAPNTRLILSNIMSGDSTMPHEVINNSWASIGDNAADFSDVHSLYFTGNINKGGYKNGLKIDECSWIIVNDNELSYHENAVTVKSSSNIIIEGNTLSKNSKWGFFADSCSGIVVDSNSIVSNGKGCSITNSEFATISSSSIKDNVSEGDTVAVYLSNITKEVKIAGNELRGSVSFDIEDGKANFSKNIASITGDELTIFDLSGLDEITLSENNFENYTGNYFFLKNIEQTIIEGNKSQGGLYFLVDNSTKYEKDIKGNSFVKISNNNILGDSLGSIVFKGGSISVPVRIDSNKNFGISVEKATDAKINYNTIGIGLSLTDLTDTTTIIGNEIDGELSVDSLEGNITFSGNKIKNTVENVSFNFGESEEITISDNLFEINETSVWISLSNIGNAIINHNKSQGPINLLIDNSQTKGKKLEDNFYIEILGNQILGDSTGVIGYLGGIAAVPVRIDSNKNFGISVEKATDAKINYNTIGIGLSLTDLTDTTTIIGNEIDGELSVDSLEGNITFSGNKIKNTVENVSFNFGESEEITISDNLFEINETSVWISLSNIGNAIINHNKSQGPINLLIDNSQTKGKKLEDNFYIEILGNQILGDSTGVIGYLGGIAAVPVRIDSNKNFGISVEKATDAKINYNTIGIGLSLTDLTDTTTIIGNEIDGELSVDSLEGNITFSGNKIKNTVENVSFNFGESEEITISDNLFEINETSVWISLSNIGNAIINHNKSQGPINLLIDNSQTKGKKLEDNFYIEILGNQILGDSTGVIGYLGGIAAVPVRIDSNKNFGISVEKATDAKINYNTIGIGLSLTDLTDTTTIIGNEINDKLSLINIEGSIILSDNTIREKEEEIKFVFTGLDRIVIDNNLLETNEKENYITLKKIGKITVNNNKSADPIYIDIDNTGFIPAKLNDENRIAISGNEILSDTIGTIKYNGAELAIPVEINLNKKFGITAEKTYDAEIIENNLPRALQLTYLRGDTQIKKNRVYYGANIKYVNDDALKQSNLIIEDNTFRNDTASANGYSLKIENVYKGTNQGNPHLIKSSRFDGKSGNQIELRESDYFTISDNIIYGQLHIFKSKEYVIDGNALQVPEGKTIESGITLFIDCENIQLTDNVIGGFYDAGINIHSCENAIEIKSNKIGTNEDGSIAVPNGTGINLYSSQNVIIDGNLISGNKISNIEFSYECNNNIIRNNIIGPNAALTERFLPAPAKAGIKFYEECNDNLIEYNILSGLLIAIDIYGYSEKDACSNNIISNNHFGINNLDNSTFANRVKLMNLADISIHNGKYTRIEHNWSPCALGFIVLSGKSNRIFNNVIGMYNEGTLPGVLPIGIAFGGKENIIEYNNIYSQGYAIMMAGDGTSGNLIKNNKIGINRNGTALIDSSGKNGITIAEGASSNTVSNNIIGGSSGGAIWIQGIGTKFNILQDNIIGTDETFSKKFKNKRGIVVYNASNNIIRHNTIGHSDIMDEMGILIEGENTKNNLIYGNRIGTSLSGIPKITNYYGIHSQETSGNTISENKIWYNYTGLSEFASNNLYHNNDVQFNYGNTGVTLNNSHSTFSGNIIANDSTDGIKCRNGSSPTIIDNNIFNNLGFGLINTDPSVLINATGNWWGDPSGPSGNGPGSGNAVTGNVSYQNWLTQGISLTLNASTDSLFMMQNQTDSAFFFYKNYNNPNDTLNVTISSDKDWIVSDTSFTVDLSLPGSGISKIVFALPPEAVPNDSARVYIKAVSQSDSFLTAKDTMMVIVYEGSLKFLRVNPDSTECQPGDTLKFFAAGYDQIQNQITTNVVWSASGGGIDTAGNFVASISPGLYYVTARDTATNIADSAIVVIRGELEIPAPPVLTNPANNSLGISPTVTLRWDAVELVLYYMVQVSPDSLFDSLIVDVTNLTNTYNLSGLDYLSNYYWRVKVLNSGGESGWSDIWTFKTLGQPSTVTLLHPINNAVNQPLEIEFQWSKSIDYLKKKKTLDTELIKVSIQENQEEATRIKKDGIDSHGSKKPVNDREKDKQKLLTDSKLAITNYWFELVKDTISLTGLTQDTTLTDTFKVVSNLGYFTDYYWRAKAKNETGWGSFTNWYKLTTVIEKPETPVLATPLNNSTQLVIPVTLGWSPVERVENYIVQICLDSLCNNVVRQDTIGTDTSLVLPQINIHTYYFWRVKAVNIGGESEWTTIWSFKTLGSPTVVTLINPEPNAVNQPLEIQFVWTKALDQIKRLNETEAVEFVKEKLHASDNDFIQIKTKDIPRSDKPVNVLNESHKQNVSDYKKTDDGVKNNSQKKGSEDEKETDKKDKSKLVIGNYGFELVKDTINLSGIIRDTTIVDTFKVVSNLGYFTDYFWRVKAKNETGWGSFTGWFKFTTIIEAPAAPLLAAPFNNSIGNVVPVSLIWFKGERVQNYIVNVAYDSLFNNIIASDTIGTDTSYTLQTLTPLSEYCWRIKAANAGGESNWSETWKFKTLGPPSTVALIHPVNNAVNQPVGLEFNWSKSIDYLKKKKTPDTELIKVSMQENQEEAIGIKKDGINSHDSKQPVNDREKDKQKLLTNSKLAITNYWFELVKDTISLTGLTQDTTLTDTFKVVSNLGYFTDYFWRVKAKNETGWGSFTGWFKFTTIIEAPAAPLLAAPFNNSIGNVVPVSLIWFKGERVQNYIVNVAYDSLFNNIIASDTIGTDTSYTLQTLTPLSEYCWRIKAANAGGESNWSETWKFKTLGLPTVVFPIQPTSNSINQPVEIQFVWSKSIDQTKRKEEFIKKLLSAKEKIPAADEQIFNKNELNRIKMDKNVHVNNQSQTKIVNIDGEETYNKNYKKKIVVSNYWFELVTDTVIFSNALSDSTVTDTFKVISNLSYLTDYYWRVKAKNETGWGTFNNWSKFSTIIERPDTPSLFSPLNNSTNQPLTLPFVWLSSNRAEQYRFVVSKDSAFQSIVIDSTLTDTTFIMTGLNYYTKYYWRIKAKNIGGESVWSEQWNLRTSPPPIDWCNLQDPVMDTIMHFNSVNIYVRVRIDSITNQQGEVDSLQAWIGYNSENTNPASWVNWIPAVFNNDVGNNDEYVAVLGSSLPPGTYYFASRFQYLGDNFAYGGYSSDGGGFWDSTNYVSGYLHIQSQLILLWERSIANSNLPAWFGTDTERGLGYGFIPDTYSYNNNHRLFVVSRSDGIKVKLLDAETGTDVSELNTSGISGGTIPLNDIELSEDGIIFGCNVTADASINPFKIYIWVNLSSAPTQIISYASPEVVSLGEIFTVVGNYSTGTAQIWVASGSNSSAGKVYKWSMSGGSFNSIPGIVALSDNAFGAAAATYPLTTGEFYWNANEQNVKKYNSSGNLVGTIPSLVIPVESNSIKYMDRVIGNEYIATFQYGEGKNNAIITEITNGVLSDAIPYAITNSLGNAANPNGTGDIAIRHNPDGSKNIFVLATNNGIAAYRTVESIPVELTLFNGTVIDRNIKLNWITATEKNSYGFELERMSETTGWNKIEFIQAAGNSLEENIYEYIDSKLNAGNYLYRLKMIDYGGSFTYSESINAEIELPLVYKIEQNYPNPFNPTTKLEYQLPFNSEVKIELYSITGERVATLVNEQKTAGYYLTVINASSLQLASGVYIYRMIATNNFNKETFVQVKKLVVLK